MNILILVTTAHLSIFYGPCLVTPLGLLCIPSTNTKNCRFLICLIAFQEEMLPELVEKDQTKTVHPLYTIYKTGDLQIKDGHLDKTPISLVSV